MTRPTNLFYEMYVFNLYLQIMNYLQDNLNKVATLEEDLELLQRGESNSTEEPIGFEYRMAVVYRSEKKKILRSQINLIKKVISVLNNIEDVITQNSLED